MPKRSLAFLLSSGLLSVFIGSCSQKSAPQDLGGCSSGPTYLRDQIGFPVENDPTQYPKCIPHCGYTGDGLGGPGLGFYYADALPSGACTNDGATCSMTVAITCCGGQQRGPTGGPVHGMRCRCQEGAWKCVIAAMGGAICRCFDGEAGVDASGDARADVGTDGAPP